MPLVILLVLPLAAVAVAIVLMPIGLIQRYRAVTARRVARAWLAILNVGVLSFSVFFFLFSAALVNLWVRNALLYSVAGLAGGCLLGIVGLALTRWELGPGGLCYTPNRFLALGITLLVAARLGYGIWRLWNGWSLGTDDRGMLIESGVAGSLAAGAVVLGYSLAYWIGVSRRARRPSGSLAAG